MAVILEERPYGSDSTEEEIKAIRECIYLYKDGILMYNVWLLFLKNDLTGQTARRKR